MATSRTASQTAPTPAVRRSPCASRSKDGNRSLTVAALIGAATVRERLAIGPRYILRGSRASGWPTHIKPALAEAAVPRNFAQKPHQRIAPAARHRRREILPETARATHFAGQNANWLIHDHYSAVYQMHGTAAQAVRCLLYTSPSPRD